MVIMRPFVVALAVTLLGCKSKKPVEQRSAQAECPFDGELPAGAQPEHLGTLTDAEGMVVFVSMRVASQAHYGGFACIDVARHGRAAAISTGFGYGLYDTHFDAACRPGIRAFRLDTARLRDKLDVGEWLCAGTLNMHLVDGDRMTVDTDPVRVTISVHER